MSHHGLQAFVDILAIENERLFIVYRGKRCWFDWHLAHEFAYFTSMLTRRKESEGVGAWGVCGWPLVLACACCFPVRRRGGCAPCGCCFPRCSACGCGGFHACLVVAFPAEERLVIRVTVEDVEDVEDVENGDTETKEITDDVVVVTAGRHFVDTVTKYANGTQIWTIKVADGGAE